MFVLTGSGVVYTAVMCGLQKYATDKEFIPYMYLINVAAKCIVAYMYTHNSQLL